MKRSLFLKTLFSASAGIGLSKYSSGAELIAPGDRIINGNSFSVDDNRISFYMNEISEPLKIIQISDTHLFMDDSRGEPFSQFSRRMAKAYNTTKHFRTGEETNPEKAFNEVLELALKKNADLLALTGDIFSFPSERAIEWLTGRLDETGIPYVYTAGNHDWHYEGMEGSSHQLREKWTGERLKKLYGGNDPMMAVHKVKGINVVTIDNSVYEIIPQQLEFFREQAGKKEPFILMMHIPLYAPGRSLGYGCGHPSWGGKSDKSFELERREKWPMTGHTKVTMDFYEEVFTSADLLGIFAGHVHQQTIDSVNGIPQFCARANAMGAFLEIDFRAMT